MTNNISGNFHTADLPYPDQQKKNTDKKSHELQHQQRELSDWKKGLADDIAGSEKFDQGTVSPILRDPRCWAYWARYICP